MVVAQVSRLNTAGHGTIRVEGPGRCGCSARTWASTPPPGQLPAGRQLLLAQTSTPGTRRRGVRAAAHVSPTQVQNSSSSPEPDLNGFRSVLVV
jgi:hypothetical protein